MSKQQRFTLTGESVDDFTNWLVGEERASATIEKYTRDLQAFVLWSDGKEATKKSAAQYKRELAELKKPATVNSAIAALNAYFIFMRWDIKLKPLKIQKQTFRREEKELTRAEYERLLQATRAKGNNRLHLILQAICSTGIRVSELQYITVEAARSGQATITNKGKTRTIFLPKKLTAALLHYAKQRGISSGCIFITKTGKPIDRRDIWASMKKLCATAKVDPSKVFPHNLRALFAREFYSKHKDVVRLADTLGHSNMETTRTYTMESGAIHRRLIEKLDLVIGL